MLRRAYEKTMELAAHRNAPWALAGVAFIESSVFPIPPDVVLIPMVLAERRKAWLYAAIATVGSVLGGIFGYIIGYFLFDTIGEPILRFYGYTAKFEEFASWYNDWGAWIVFMAGVTPFPYKVITIASGVTHLNFFVFMLASIAARGLRFFVVAGLLYWFGPPIKDFIEKYLGILFTLFVILLIGGFVLIKYVF
ncbi:MAG: YqaA family protein [Hyphomicrobiales bacterium]